jgi:hypothetical protein
MHYSLLLKLPGIIGTAKQSGHVGEIDLMDLDGLVNPKGIGSTTRRGSESSRKWFDKASNVWYSSFGPGEFTAWKRFDETSDALIKATWMRTTFVEAVLTVLTLSNEEAAQYRFRGLAFVRTDNFISGDPEYAGQPIRELVQKLAFMFQVVDVKQMVAPPPPPGLPRVQTYDII